MTGILQAVFSKYKLN